MWEACYPAHFFDHLKSDMCWFYVEKSYLFTHLVMVVSFGKGSPHSPFVLYWDTLFTTSGCCIPEKFPPPCIILVCIFDHRSEVCPVSLSRSVPGGGLMTGTSLLMEERMDGKDDG